jgi:hypothetical protein
MGSAVKIEGGFAEVGAGEWLAGHGQPAAFFGAFRRLRRKGWFVRDRAALDRVRIGGRAFFSLAAAPFLTHIPCAAPISAVSSKVLVAPVEARTSAEVFRPVPMSVRWSFATTMFEREWVVMATRSRTARISVEDGETLSVRPDAAVAWTGNRPTGFCARLGLVDLILPVAPRELLLNFHGPCIVWVEGAKAPSRRIEVGRRVYGV